MFSKIGGGAAALVLLPAVALAADLPSRRAPVVVPPPPILSWDGFYAGLNAGGVFGDGSVTTIGTPISSNPAGVANGAPATLNALTAVLPSNARGSNGQFIGGGQLGYNYQFRSAYILGAEADIKASQGPAERPTLLRPRPSHRSVSRRIIMGRSPPSRNASII